MLRLTVAHAGDVLGDVDRRIGVVSYSEQQHLAVELVHASGRAIEAVRHVHGMRQSDARGLRAERGERMGTVAAQDARHPPEAVGERPHGATGHAAAIERRVVVVGHARHDEGSAFTERREQRLDEAAGPALNRCNFRECRVHQQHTACFDAQRVKLSCQLACCHPQVILHV